MPVPKKSHNGDPDNLSDEFHFTNAARATENRRNRCRRAQATVECPVCKQQEGDRCIYVAFEKHLGEPLPDEWTHYERRKLLELGW